MPFRQCHTGAPARGAASQPPGAGSVFGPGTPILGGRYPFGTHRKGHFRVSAVFPASYPKMYFLCLLPSLPVFLRSGTGASPARMRKGGRRSGFAGASPAGSLPPWGALRPGAGRPGAPGGRLFSKKVSKMKEIGPKICKFVFQKWIPSNRVSDNHFASFDFVRFGPVARQLRNVNLSQPWTQDDTTPR